MAKVLLFKPSTYSGAGYGTTLARKPSPPVYPPRPSLPSYMSAKLRMTILKDWEMKVAAMKAQYEADLKAWEAANAPAPSGPVTPPGFQTFDPIVPGASSGGSPATDVVTDVVTDLTTDTSAEVIDLFPEEDGDEEGFLTQAVDMARDNWPFIVIGVGFFSLAYIATRRRP